MVNNITAHPQCQQWWKHATVTIWCEHCTRNQTLQDYKCNSLFKFFASFAALLLVILTLGNDAILLLGSRPNYCLLILMHVTKHSTISIRAWDGEINTNQRFFKESRLTLLYLMGLGIWKLDTLFFILYSCILVNFGCQT